MYFLLSFQHHTWSFSFIFIVTKLFYLFYIILYLSTLCLFWLHCVYFFLCHSLSFLTFHFFGICCEALNTCLKNPWKVPNNSDDIYLSLHDTKRAHWNTKSTETSEQHSDIRTPKDVYTVVYSLGTRRKNCMSCYFTGMQIHAN